MSIGSLVDSIEEAITKERIKHKNLYRDDLVYAVIEELHQRYGYAKSSNSEYKQSQCGCCLNKHYPEKCKACNNYSNFNHLQ